jgi:hypothetical protein
MPRAEFDKQGKLFFYLWKTAGWSQERVNKLLVKRYKTTHWNALTTQEKSALIATMQTYAAKAERDMMKQAPGIRQSIMGLVVRHGRNKDWLHEQMKEWGYGESMRELGYSQLQELRRDVINCFIGIKPGGEK